MAFVILVDYIITGIDATICADKANSDGFTNVLPMCRSGSLTAGRVVVDTNDTGVLDYDSCRCTVSLSGTNTGPVNLQTGPYPGTAPASDCGSILRFNRHPTNTYTEYQCTRLSGDIISNFANNELLNITLSKVNNNTQLQSGYCILIKSGVNLRVTCDSPDTLLASSTPEAVMTTTTTTTTTTSTTMTTPPTTMTTTPVDVKSGCCKCDQPTIPLVGVVVPIVVTLLVVAVATVANVILYKRRLTMVNELKSGSHVMTSQDTVHYDSLDQSRVEPPNTYEEMSTRQTYVNTAMST
ncbi:hypothetical protein KP79_PYT06802 [Mizuhopecten yessoensis]|uniref:CUB domain-containing protein n=2 Tax=Mizuhopecten yessoensis TaxID=6573 RepID=A0A210QIC9_MIZYE|nr:hypothetical protein KP79_PYT06802 [Mizuhopecten yessoensis]